MLHDSMIPQDLVCTKDQDNSPTDCLLSLDNLGLTQKLAFLPVWRQQL